MDKLSFVITKKIEEIGKVNAKLTMIITETQMAPIFFETPAVQTNYFSRNIFYCGQPSLQPESTVAVAKSESNAHRSG